MRRISSICKWTLTVLLALVLSLEIASVWYCFSWVKRHESGVPDGDWYTMVILDRGAVGMQKKGEGLVDRFGFYPPQPLGFALKRYNAGPDSPVARPFAWWRPMVHDHPGPFLGPLHLPLTYPILALALPTGWLWLGDFRRRMKARAGCCRTCGYDLRGLEQANKEDKGHQPTRCPECGEPAATA